MKESLDARKSAPATPKPAATSDAAAGVDKEAESSEKIQIKAII